MVVADYSDVAGRGTMLEQWGPNKRAMSTESAVRLVVLLTYCTERQGPPPP